MAQTEKSLRPNGSDSRQAKDVHAAEVMHEIASLSRELNTTVTMARDAIELALRGLSRLIPADALRLTLNASEDRQQLQASLEHGSEVEHITDGDIVRVSHTMLEHALRTGAPAFFNDAPAELISDALVVALVCPAAQSILCAPLTFSAKHTGMLIASTPQAGAYTAQDADIASTVACLLAATLARIEFSMREDQAREREEARSREEGLIERLHSAAQSSGELDQIIQHAVDALARALPASFVVLRPVSFGRPEPILRAWTPGNDRPPLEIHAPVAKLERPVYTEYRSVLIEDVRAEQRADSRDLTSLVERLGARSLYLSPIMYGGQILAAIGLVESDAQKRWTQEEQLLLARVAKTIAPLILNAHLNARLRSYIEDLLTLLSLAAEVTGEAELDRALRAVLDSWSKITGTDAAAILRWDEEAKLLRLAAAKHLPVGILERYTKGLPLTDPICGLAAERRVGVAADLASEARLADLHAAVRWSGLRGIWATPILGPAGKLWGMLVTFSRVPAKVSPDEQRLADLFTRPAALAMQHLEASRVERTQALAIKERDEKLRQAEQHKTEFLSIISHELRTPLNAIIGFAEMLKEGYSGPLNEQQSSDIQTISDSANKLLSMVEDTLDLARIDAERFPVYMDTVAFEEIIKRSVESVRSMAEMKGLVIDQAISEDVPVVRTDPERVRQILASLLSNAIKFTESGSVRISVERADADSVQVSVIDTGIGFDTAAFPHIFEEFRQGDSSNTRTHGGSGLGLAVSKRLVQRLGGHIGVTSTPGEGSTFWFRLPPEIPGADN